MPWHNMEWRDGMPHATMLCNGCESNLMVLPEMPNPLLFSIPISWRVVIDGVGSLLYHYLGSAMQSDACFDAGLLVRVVGAG